jgi:uroporphyrinogen-III synthase
MTRPLALLRPEPGWSASAVAARAAGLEVVGRPLFAAEAVAWQLPARPFDALLAGSGAAFRLGGEGLANLTSLPVYAVGDATAEAARSAGFSVARTGEGGLQQLLDGVAGAPLRFLRLAAEARVDVTPNPGQSVTECVVYRMAPSPIGSGLLYELKQSKPLIALHSAAAAAHFAQEVERLGIARGDLALLALGSRVAEAAGPGWAAVHIADRPSDAALLAKAAALCK